MFNTNFVFKSYEDEPTMKRKLPIDPTNIVSPRRKKRIYYCNGFDNIPSEEVEIHTLYINEHEYESATTSCVSGCARSEPYIKCSHCFSKDKKIAELLLIIEKQKHSISQLQEKLQKEKRKQAFDISNIQHNDKSVKIYTGLQNAKLSYWLDQFIMVKADSLHCYDQKSIQKRRVT